MAKRKAKKTKPTQPDLEPLWDDDDVTLPIQDTGEAPIPMSSIAAKYTKRFIAAIQQAPDSCSYNHFADSDNLNDLKKKAEARINAESKKGKELGIVIYDKHWQVTNYRYNLCPRPVVRKMKGKTVILNEAEVNKRVKAWVQEG